MTTNLKGLGSPEKIADAGERIYAEQYKAQLEATQRGHFVAIDVTTGEGYVAEFPEQALGEARAKAPAGIFHLIRVGAPGAFTVSFGHARNDFWGRPLQQPR
jgi:hypothetical protein